MTFSSLPFTVLLAKAEFKCHNKVDMVILVDGSGSITRKQFKIAQNFAAGLVKHFDISKEKTNVAVASYSQYTHIGRTFQEHASQESVLTAINNLKYEGAASRLDFGFGLVEFKLFDTQYGSRPSKKGKAPTVHTGERVASNASFYMELHEVLCIRVLLNPQRFIV